MPVNSSKPAGSSLWQALFPLIVCFLFVMLMAALRQKPLYDMNEQELSRAIGVSVTKNVNPVISTVGGSVRVGQRSSLRIEGKNFDPETVQVVIFGGKCTEGCVVPNDVLGEDGGTVTTTLIGAAPVTINHAGTFQAAVRNGDGGPLSNKMDFEAK